MKITKSTTTAHFKVKPPHNPLPELFIVFEQLKTLLRPYLPQLEVRSDKPYHYDLWTKEWVRIKVDYHRHRNTKIQFVAIWVHEKHVSLNFHPLFLDKTIRQNLSDELKKFSKGVAVLHFSSLEMETMEALKKLFAEGWASYKKIRAVVE